MERPQTHVLNRTATMIGTYLISKKYFVSVVSGLLKVLKKMVIQVNVRGDADSP
jgi:hypothetical protein